MNEENVTREDRLLRCNDDGYGTSSDTVVDGLHACARFCSGLHEWRDSARVWILSSEKGLYLSLRCISSYGLSESRVKRGRKWTQQNGQRGLEWERGGRGEISRTMQPYESPSWTKILSVAYSDKNLIYSVFIQLRTLHRFRAGKWFIHSTASSWGSFALSGFWCVCVWSWCENANDVIAVMLCAPFAVGNCWLKV